MNFRRLIVTGDDFGLCLPVNDAIERAHRNGILSTASLMVAAPEAADAVQRARRMPSLRVGLHLVLVHGRPMLAPERIPALVDAKGEFSTQLVRAGINFFFRPSVRRQLEAEIRAQFEAFAATGLALDHVNAHNHMHVHPTVLSLILKVGRAYGLCAVRLPREPFVASWRSARKGFAARLGNAVFLAPWTALMKARLRLAGMACNDFIFGMNDTGRMSEGLVLRLLAHLPNGVSEVYFHPAARAWPGKAEAMANYACEEELAALTSPAVASVLRTSDIRTVTFGNLARARL